MLEKGPSNAIIVYDGSVKYTCVRTVVRKVCSLGLSKRTTFKKYIITIVIDMYSMDVQISRTQFDIVLRA